MHTFDAFSVVSDYPDFVVIDKRPGIAFHKDETAAGLVMLLAAHLGYPLFPVHRLDKVTSGLLVFAKHPQAAKQLSMAFAQRDVDKFYLAISDKKPNKKQALVIGDMLKARRGCWRLTKTRENPAITRVISGALTAGKRLYCIRPATGKTHQIRVALKSLGAPIVGDSAYGGTVADRTYLHAWQLRFTYLNKPYDFRVDPSIGQLFSGEALATLLNRWQRPYELDWPGKQGVKHDQR